MDDPLRQALREDAAQPTPATTARARRLLTQAGLPDPFASLASTLQALAHRRANAQTFEGVRHRLHLALQLHVRRSFTDMDAASAGSLILDLARFDTEAADRALQALLDLPLSTRMAATDARHWLTHPPDLPLAQHCTRCGQIPPTGITPRRPWCGSPGCSDPTRPTP